MVLFSENFIMDHFMAVEETELKPETQNVHEGQKKHKCDKCGKAFDLIGSLEIHIQRVHEDLNDYICNICSKSFGEAGTLKIHIGTVHEGHKEHKCDQCERSFIQV